MSILLSIQVLERFWESCSAHDIFSALSWSLVQIFSEKNWGWRGISVATAGVRDAGVMKPEKMHIIFIHVEGFLTVHFYRCQKDWFLKYFEKNSKY